MSSSLTRLSMLVAVQLSLTSLGLAQSETINYNKLPYAVDAAQKFIYESSMATNKRADGLPYPSSQVGVFELMLLRAISEAENPQSSVLSSPIAPAAVVIATSQTQKQNGATVSSNASTSATEKPGIPTLLGVAVENGAITNNINGNTMTLSSTLYGVIAGFRGDTDKLYKSCALCTLLGTSATFNLTSSTNPLQQASRRQISQWQLKYTFRDTTERSPAASRLYRKLVSLAAGDLAAKLSNPVFDTPLQKMNALFEDEDKKDSSPMKQALQDVVAAKAGGASALTLTDDRTAKCAADLLTRLQADNEFQQLMGDLLKDPAVIPALKQLSINIKNYLVADTYYLSAASNLPNGFNGALTFGQQYPATSTTSSTGTVNTPTYFTGGLVISYTPGAAPLQQQNGKALPKNASPLNAAEPTAKNQSPPSPFVPSATANFITSFYPNPLPSANEQTFRGGTASAQLQWTLGKGPFIVDPLDKSKTTISLSGNYSRLQENQHQIGKKVDIALGNMKLEIPIASGVSFPLSISFANASEQVKETYVKGNFGVSFDLGTLSALLKNRN